MYRSYPGLPTKNANFLGQVRLLRRTLQAAGPGDVPVGTVVNVAVSRAMCLAFIVASPRLLESHARTVEQMWLINALRRFAEMAEEQSGAHDSTH